MKRWFKLFFCMLLALGVSSCEDTEERRARYAEKKPEPKPLEKKFTPPPPLLPKDAKEEIQAPSMVEYKGEDIAQVTGLSGKKVLLVFYAPWCVNCAAFKDELITYAEKEREKCHIVTIDADKYPNLADEFGVQAVPKVVLYVEGMRLRDMVGKVSAERLRELIDKILEADSI